MKNEKKNELTLTNDENSTRAKFEETLRKNVQDNILYYCLSRASDGPVGIYPLFISPFVYKIFFHVLKLSDYLISFQNPSLKCILSLFFPTTFLQTVTHDQLVCLRPVETFKPYMFITIFEGHYVYY